jgi:hypothetical protein
MNVLDQCDLGIGGSCNKDRSRTFNGFSDHLKIVSIL